MSGVRTGKGPKAKSQTDSGQDRAGRAHQARTIPREGETSMSEKRLSTEEMVDMELRCVRCQTRLYVSVSQVRAVIASVERTGAAILICVCGQAQLIWSQQKQRND